MNLRPLFLVAGVLMLSISWLAGAAETSSIPVADFFRNPVTAKPAGASPVRETRLGGERLPAVQVSPDGQYVSMISRTDKFPDARNIVITQVGDWDAPRVITDSERGEVRWHEWSRDGRLIYRVDRGYEDTHRGSLAYLALFTIRADGTDTQAVGMPFNRLGNDWGMNGPADAYRYGGTYNWALTGGTEPYAFGDAYGYLDGVPSDPDHALIQEYEAAMFPAVRRLNLRNGWLTTISRGRMNFTDWFADHRGQVRAAIGRGEVRDDLRYDLYYRESEDADWRSVMTFEDANVVQVHGFDRDNQHLWVSARVNSDRMALYKLDPDDGDFGAPIHQDPVFDVGGLASRLVRARDGTPLYFQYATDTQGKIFLHDDGPALQAAIDKGLPGTQNDIVSWDDEWQRFIVHAWSDREPGTFYLFERDTGELSKMLDTRPWLDRSRLSAMEPIEFKARDGLMLRGYLTRPAGHTDETAPLIVRVHDGPFAVRDRWRFNVEVQFLASRGYQVLQVNYRGSGGYGYAFEAAGFGRLGQEMQDDLSDAVAWAVKQGIADPDNVAIYGAGYGGYAALMGLAETPDLFRTGISYAAVSNLPRFRRDQTRPWKPGGFPDWTGNRWDRYVAAPADPEHEPRTNSPIDLAADIDAPLMMIHGHFDSLVDIDVQYWPMVRALKSADNPPLSFVRRFEGHGFVKEQHNIELYSAIQDFLASNMPTPMNPAPQSVAVADE
ncbi:MAG: prolyl oligopeptidase family serine peptidase [Gammaproteobacteria bacterium]|jgi:dipeptidyl aminopeptidase/acylaminoacyl peptidase